MSFLFYSRLLIYKKTKKIKIFFSTAPPENHEDLDTTRAIPKLIYPKKSVDN